MGTVNDSSREGAAQHDRKSIRKKPRDEAVFFRSVIYIEYSIATFRGKKRAVVILARRYIE